MRGAFWRRTLEVFHDDMLQERPGVAVNRPGFGQIAFEVDDVPSAREALLGCRYLQRE